MDTVMRDEGGTLRREPFSVGEALSFGWGVMKARFRDFAPLVGITLVLQLLHPRVTEHPGLFAFVFGTAIQAAQLLVTMGWLRVALRAHDGRATSLEDVRAVAPQFFAYLLAWIVYVVAVVIGTIFLVVPGVLVAVRAGFFGFLVVDEGLDPAAAIRRSVEMTRGHVGALLVAGIVLALVNLAGVLALGIGLFATIPTTAVAAAYIYRRMQRRAEAPIDLTRADP